MRLPPEPDDNDRQLPPGWRVERYDALPSTQSTLIERLDVGGAGDRTAIVSRVQTAGRGRLGSDWVSPPGGLWVSFARRLRGAPHPGFGLRVAHSLLVGLRAELRQPSGGRLSIKWPNDLVIDGERKFGGLIVQARPGAGRDSTLYVVGLGVDLAVDAAAISRVGGVSLAEEIGEVVTPEDLLPRFLGYLESSLDGGSPLVLDDVVADISTIGRRIRWLGDDGEAHSGYARALDPSGFLVVDHDDGRSSTLHSERVQHVRPE